MCECGGLRCVFGSMGDGLWGIEDGIICVVWCLVVVGEGWSSWSWLGLSLVVVECREGWLVWRVWMGNEVDVVDVDNELGVLCVG